MAWPFPGWWRGEQVLMTNSNQWARTAWHGHFQADAEESRYEFSMLPLPKEVAGDGAAIVGWSLTSWTDIMTGELISLWMLNHWDFRVMLYFGRTVWMIYKGSNCKVKLQVYNRTTIVQSWWKCHGRSDEKPLRAWIHEDLSELDKFPINEEKAFKRML